MSLILENTDPNFRNLTDLLLFSNRTDLDLKHYSNYFKNNKVINIKYFWDRFQKSANIFWNDSHDFWYNRFSVLLSLNNKIISRNIQKFLEKRMYNLLRNKRQISLKYDMQYIQYLQFYKVKNDRKESLISVKKFLLNLTEKCNTDKVLEVINTFIPLVFKDMNEYTENISKKITFSPLYFSTLLKLEKSGIPLNKLAIATACKDFLNESRIISNEARAFFAIIDNKEILDLIKQIYDEKFKKNILRILTFIDFRILEEFHLKNIMNLIKLDSSITDDIVSAYIEKLYNRRVKHKRANIDRVIRLIKICPEISEKKILVLLSNKNKINDIKYIIKTFPELKKLSTFI